MGHPEARHDSALEPELLATPEWDAKLRPLSTLDSDSLASQIVALDGVSHLQAQQQIREMLGFDLGACNPNSVTIYNRWTTTRSQRIALNSRSAGEDPCDSSPSGSEAAVQHVGARGELEAIPLLLDLLCDATGVRFAAVARVAEDHEAACAVIDSLSFGPLSGCEVDLQSYVSTPIMTADGRRLGNLCAIGPTHAGLPQPQIVLIFRRLARLIGQQLESELARARQQAALDDERATAQRREESMAILAHELRNPLHAVLATADMLERRLGVSAHAKMAAHVKAHVRRMSTLIDDVLDFARARLGSGLGVQMRAVDDLEDALTAIVTELQVAHADRVIEADVCVHGRVECDVGRLQQVASNLIANALTHGLARSPVRVRASADDGYLTFSVWNDGVAIPGSIIGKVFEPFWQPPGSAGHQGLGLGLYICSQIVHAHGGELAVSSTNEAGTKFSVRLPLRQPQHASSSNGASPQPHDGNCEDPAQLSA